MTPHRGVLVLVLGILGLVGCGILTAIPAWVIGSGDLKAMDAGTMDPSGRSLTNAGKICGMIATIIAGFWSLMSGTFFLMTLRAAGVLA